MSPSAGGGGLRGLSHCVQLYTWGLKKLLRSTCIFNLCSELSLIRIVHIGAKALLGINVIFWFSYIAGLPQLGILLQVVQMISTCRRGLGGGGVGTL